MAQACDASDKAIARYALERYRIFHGNYTWEAHKLAYKYTGPAAVPPGARKPSAAELRAEAMKSGFNCHYREWDDAVRAQMAGMSSSCLHLQAGALSTRLAGARAEGVRAPRRRKGRSARRMLASKWRAVHQPTRRVPAAGDGAVQPGAHGVDHEGHRRDLLRALSPTALGKCAPAQATSHRRAAQSRR